MPDAAHAARTAPHLFHQPQQQIDVLARPARAELLAETDVQHRHVLKIGTHVDGNPDRAVTTLLHSKQGLDVGQPGHAYAQPLTVVDDLGRTELVDDVDDAIGHAALAAVEEQQPLERMALPPLDTRCKRDVPTHGCHSVRV
jgi:hypothetical protein